METYDEILDRMTAGYASYAGFAPAEESDIMIRLRVLAGEIYRLKVNGEFVERQMFPSTATGDYLDRHAAQRGLSRKEAVKAAGQVTFYPEMPEHPDIMIPAGTEVCTYMDMRRFRTDSAVLLAENAQSVTADASAVEAGAASNARAGTVNIIATPITGVGGVSNEAEFVNGADRESDEELRSRVIDSYVNIVNGANAAYYRSLALSVPGVYAASVIPRARGNGTVDVYICDRGRAASPAVKAQVQQLMNEERELNVDVLVRDPAAVGVQLYIRIAVAPGYDFNAVAGEVSAAVRAYINDRGIGGDVLLCKVGEVICHIKGVDSYRFLENYGTDVIVGDSRYPVAGTITVREQS